MRKLLLMVCILAQIGALAWIVWGRENIINNGKRIVVRTAPLDPRDPFRGDFVRLRYLMNRSTPDLLRGSLAGNERKPGQVVYAVMEERPGGVFERSYYTTEPPANEVYIKGRFASEVNWLRPGTSFIKYGVEQMFVEQGSGIVIEERQGVRGGMQTAMEVELALGGDGTAVLVDYQWADFAIAVDISQPETNTTDTNNQNEQNEQNEQNGDDSAPRPVIAVTIQNMSDIAQALVNSDDQCSFSLQGLRQNEAIYRPAQAECKALSPNEDFLVLQPGEQVQLDLNLASARWLMTREGKQGDTLTGDIREIASGDQFRLVYSTPNQLPETASDATTPVWAGELISQSFNGIGVFD